MRVRGGTCRGARLELDLRCEKAYWLGHHEPAVQEFIRAYVGKGDVVYDVGAHIGFFSICSARLGASVYAFEPVPGNARRIRRNAALNRLAVSVVDAAVWDSSEGVHLDDAASTSEWRTVPGAGVASTTLDRFALGNRPPTFVKIDVEGAEARVLRGATRILRESRPVLLCEIHGEACRIDVVALLEAYELVAVGGSSWIGAFPRASP